MVADTIIGPMPLGRICFKIIFKELAMNRGTYPYLGLIPGICICLAVMAVNFIGDGLRDAFDPKTKN